MCLSCEPKSSSPCPVKIHSRTRETNMTNVRKSIINHPYELVVLYHLFMVKWGLLVYYCFTIVLDPIQTRFSRGAFGAGGKGLVKWRGALQIKRAFQQPHLLQGRGWLLCGTYRRNASKEVTSFKRQHSHIEKIFAYQVFIVLLTWVLVCNFISAQRAGNSLASEILHGVKQNAKKNWCVCRGLGWDWELNFWPSLLAFLGTHTQKIAHLRRTCALHRRHRTPHRRHRIHHTYSEIIALQNGHRIPYNIESSYSGGEGDFTFFSASTVFFLIFLFQLKCHGITSFGIWGRWRSHLKRLKFHIRSHSM